MFKMSVKYFMAVADCRSFTKSAHKMFVTQSTISKQIALLEEELGFALFSRTTRSVELTEKGQELYEFLLKIQREMRKKVDSLVGYAKLAGETLSIGAPFGWSLTRMPLSFLENFKKKYSKVNILVEKHTCKDMTRLLLAKKLDAIITLEDEIHMEQGIEYIPYYDEELVMLFSRTDPDANKMHLPEIVNGKSLFAMGFESSNCTLEYIQKAISKINLTVNVIPLPNFDSIATAVEANQGCCLTSLASYACENKKFSWVKSGFLVPIVLAWSKEGKSSLVNELAGQLRSILPEQRVKRVLEVDTY